MKKRRTPQPTFDIESIECKGTTLDARQLAYVCLGTYPKRIHTDTLKIAAVCKFFRVGPEELCIKRKNDTIVV